MNDLNKGTLVVTGGGGLIGSAIVWGLNNLGYRNIWIIDWIEPQSKKEKTCSL